MSAVEVIPEVGASAAETASAVARCGTCRRSWLVLAGSAVSPAPGIRPSARRTGAHVQRAQRRRAPTILLPAAMVSVLLGLLLVALGVHDPADGGGVSPDAVSPSAAAMPTD